MNILWLKSGPLYPLDSGGKIRTHAMLNEISKQHQVTYLAFKDSEQNLHADEENAPYAQEKFWIPWQEAKSGSLHFFKELLFNLFSPLPYALEKYQSKAMQERILQLDASGKFDLIICDFLFPAPNVYSIHSKLLTPCILFQHNIESEIWRRLTDTKSNPIARLYFQLQYRRMFHWEQKLSRLFKGVITVSPNDSEFCCNEYDLNNVLGEVPTGVDINFFQPSPSQTVQPTSRERDGLPSSSSQPKNLQPTASPPIQPPSGEHTPSPSSSSQPTAYSLSSSASQLRRDKQPRIAFLGSMDWMPNIECVQYFTGQVLPLVLEKLPEVQFVVIGRNPTPTVQELADQHPSIELTGSVDDIRPHLQGCDLMVVPLRAGGGTRIKIFEAMAMGVPVISTTIGAEGLPVTHGKNILIANDDQALADTCIQVLQNPDLTRQIATAARQKVEQDHSWMAVSEQFIKLCQPIINAFKHG